MNAITVNALGWVGTPYVRYGQTKEGCDCGGLSMVCSKPLVF